MDKSYLILNGDGLYDLLSDSVEFSFSEVPTMFKVTQEFIGRPDKIALAIYGDDDYWWVVVRANNLKYPFRASWTMRRDITKQFDYQIITDISLNKILLLPTINDITAHLNKIRGL